jgi:hypothetical protein
MIAELATLEEAQADKEILARSRQEGRHPDTVRRYMNPQQEGLCSQIRQVSNKLSQT